jgi:hypothetical protein
MNDSPIATHLSAGSLEGVLQVQGCIQHAGR